VSLNKTDGSLQWKTGSDHAGYSSAIIANVGGVRQVIALSGEAAIGVRKQRRGCLWHYTKVSNRTANIATPIYSDGSVFLSSAYGTGCALLKLGPKTMSEVYFTNEMKNHYSTIGSGRRLPVRIQRFDSDGDAVRNRQGEFGRIAASEKVPLRTADKHLYL